MRIAVVNQQHVGCRPEDLYIGRPRRGAGEMHYGNPFSHQQGTRAAVIVSSREESIAAFRSWLLGEAYPDVEPARRQWIRDRLTELHCDRQRKELYLVCWCNPLPCHGDVYKELLELPELPW